MNVVNIIIDEDTITAVNSDGGTHTIEIENDDEILRTYAENIQAMADPRMLQAEGGLANILGV